MLQGLHALHPEEQSMLCLTALTVVAAQGRPHTGPGLLSILQHTPAADTEHTTRMGHTSKFDPC